MLPRLKGGQTQRGHLQDNNHHVHLQLQIGHSLLVYADKYLLILDCNQNWTQVKDERARKLTQDNRVFSPTEGGWVSAQLFMTTDMSSNNVISIDCNGQLMSDL